MNRFSHRRSIDPAPLRGRRAARPGQTGAGSLPVLLVLLLGLLLFLLHSQQALIGQIRTSALQLRSASAHEAAEAGLAWALAHLNHPGGLDRQAQPPDPGNEAERAAALPARERLLTWSGGSGPQPRQSDTALACRDDAATWTCRLAPADDRPATVPVADEAQVHPAWTLQLLTGPTAGTPQAMPTLTLLATGCSQAREDCGRAPGGDLLVPEAVRRLHLNLVLLGDLVQPPRAALSAAGAVTLGAGSRVMQGDPDVAGWAVETGSTLMRQPGSLVRGPPGREADQAVQTEVASLRLPADRWWLHFQASAALMRSLPSLRHVSCPDGRCRAEQLREGLADGARALWVDGALQLDGGRWGSADRPLLLVVDGPVRLEGPVQADGWLIAESLTWSGGTGDGPRGLWQGAFTTWGEARLDGPVDLVHRPATLARLRGAIGTWTALPGSWRDHGP